MRLSILRRLLHNLKRGLARANPFERSILFDSSPAQITLEEVVYADGTPVPSEQWPQDLKRRHQAQREKNER